MGRRHAWRIGIQERREHLHWLVDTLLDNLEIVPAGEKPN